MSDNRKRASDYLRPHLIAKTKTSRAVSADNLTSIGEHWRPKYRGECPVERPCPFVGCRYHTYLDFDEESGSMKINFANYDPMDMRISCSLDIADMGGTSSGTIAQQLNLSPERIRQIERAVMERLATDELRDFFHSSGDEFASLSITHTSASQD